MSEALGAQQAAESFLVESEAQTHKPQSPQVLELKPSTLDPVVGTTREDSGSSREATFLSWHRAVGSYSSRGA